jgi:flagellar FliL protein
MANPETGSTLFKWLAGLMLIVMASLAAANVYLLMDKHEPAGAAEKLAVPVMAAPIFVTVTPFTVNLDSERCGAVLLYIGMTIKVSNSETQDYLIEHMPQLRSRLLVLLSGQDAGALITPQGKQALADSIRDMLTTSLSTPQPTLAVDEVLFTEFIVQ